MPKDRRVHTSCVARSKAFPYLCSSKDTVEVKSNNVMETEEDMKEWEEARCPICMEHPHSAVLLRCASYDKGCRPYICNTSNRHSDCLAQFRKSSTKSSAQIQPEISQSRKVRLQPKLVCPLCRGQVNGWVVIESARQFMNSKPRTCPSEACDYDGTYIELRNHIRREHPSLRPSEVDPARQHEWLRLERERELKDVLCVMLSDIGDNISPALYENLLNGFLRAMHHYP